MQLWELISLHVLIFVCVAAALAAGLLLRTVFHWLRWNWRRFSREVRRPNCVVIGLLAVTCAGSASAGGPPGGQATSGDRSRPIGSARSDIEPPGAGESSEARLQTAETEMAVASGIHWPAFRGVGTSRTTAKNVPLEWNVQSGIRWEAELSGYGQSSPIVWEDRVFVTTMQGANKETPTVVCLDLATGQKIWQREMVASQRAAVSNYTSRGAPTPAVDAQRVYAFFESGDLFVFDHKGSDEWSRSLVREYGPVEGNHGIGSSVALTREHVIVLMNHAGPSYLLALDKRTGETSWKTDYENRVGWTSPIICQHGGLDLILTSCAGIVEAHETASGTRLWQLTGQEGNTVPSPSVHGEMVIVGSSERASNMALRMPAAGDEGSPAIVWKADGPSCGFGSPLVHHGHVYFVNTAGVAFCVDLASGETRWKARLGDSCWASPLGVGDRIYFFTKSGATVVARTGTEWVELARNELALSPGAKVYGVAAVEGAILIRTGGQLYCVAKE